MQKFIPCLLFTSMAFAEGHPERFNSQFLITDKTTSTVTEKSFHSIPRAIALLFSEEAKNLIVTTDWKNPYFAAWAKKENSLYSINFWGGFARIPGMNDESYALTVCHELGHILGGLPKIKIKYFLWSSAEGQSDYYATNVCLKKYFRQQKLTLPKSLSETAFTLCRTTYGEEKEFLICLNSMKGIEGFSQVLGYLSQGQKKPSIETPSSMKVRETIYDSYPDVQCRIDTLVSATLDQPRPGCWFSE